MIITFLQNKSDIHRSSPITYLSYLYPSHMDSRSPYNVKIRLDAICYVIYSLKEYIVYLKRSRIAFDKKLRITKRII